MTASETNLTCTLSAQQEHQRRIDIKNKLFPYLTDISHSGSTTKLTFAKSDVSLALLEEFIVAEGECCAFLQFDVSEEDNFFRIAVTSPEGSEHLVREFFADDSKAKKSRCDCISAPATQTNSAQGSKFKSYAGGFFALCVMCCAAPYVLVTLGLMSVSAGAYFGRTLEVLLVLGGLAVLGHFSWRHVRIRQAE